MSLTGMLLLSFTTGSAIPAAAPQRGPDAHVIRRKRGDIVDFSDAPRIYPGDSRARYVPPVRNWKYRPVSLGERLAAPFYGASYVIATPARLQLPPARGDRRWIRYGDDILLVNIRSGRVLQVLAGRYH